MKSGQARARRARPMHGVRGGVKSLGVRVPVAMATAIAIPLVAGFDMPLNRFEIGLFAMILIISFGMATLYARDLDGHRVEHAVPLPADIEIACDEQPSRVKRILDGALTAGGLAGVLVPVLTGEIDLRFALALAALGIGAGTGLAVGSDRVIGRYERAHRRTLYVTSGSREDPMFFREAT